MPKSPNNTAKNKITSIQDGEPVFSTSPEKIGQGLLGENIVGFPKRSSVPRAQTTDDKAVELFTPCSESDVEKVKRNLQYVSHELTDKEFLARIQRPTVDLIHLKIDPLLLKQNGALRNVVNLSAVRIKDLAQMVKSLSAANAQLDQQLRSTTQELKAC